MASPNLYSASGNATLYDKSTVTPEAFEGITNDEKLTGINPSKTTTSLVKDGVYLFRTGHGKNGIFRVKEVSPGGGGRLVFTVKVQQ
ncbi:MAG: hypothetical protein NT092_12060 [Bacteroidia bacterium]|nr:hypothetical protein [Bacteroidia bacterium]